jgi:hypothetical protein
VQADLVLIHDTLRRTKDVRAQVADLGRRAEALGKGAAVKTKADAIARKLTDLEDELFNPNLKTSQDSLNYLPKLDFQFAGVAGMSDTADARPTAAAEKRYAELKAQLTGILAKVEQVLDADVRDFNAAVRAADIPAVIVLPVKAGR